jgi:putative membrane protein
MNTASSAARCSKSSKALDRFLHDFARPANREGALFMKRYVLTLMALLAIFAFACQKETNTNVATTDSSTTYTSGTDTSGTTSTGTTSTTSTGSTGGTVSSLSEADKTFVMKAANGGMAEVAGGQTAVQKATNADVKTFGQRMVTDHSKANDELKQLATTKGLALPSAPDAEHQKKLDELSKKTGKAFDKAYMDDMVKDHEEDVAEFQKQTTAAQDPDLKAWVTKTLPTLQEHLRMAKDTHKKVK